MFSMACTYVICTITDNTQFILNNFTRSRQGAKYLEQRYSIVRLCKKISFRFNSTRAAGKKGYELISGYNTKVKIKM